MDIIDKLYSLISKDVSDNTFKDNYELFKEFYDHEMYARYNGYKVIEIYKYLLSLDLENMHIIKSKIDYDISSYEQQITQSVYFGDFKPDNEYVDTLFKFIKDFPIFQKHFNLNALGFIRDYTSAMMITLNKSFLEISNDRIFEMISMIKNNDYLKKIIEDGKVGNGLLDKDYLFQYTSRYLFNLEVADPDDLDNDALLVAIKDGKITDFETLKRLFKVTDIYILLSLFEDNRLSNLLNIIENSTEDDVKRIILFNSIIQKLKDNSEYRYIIQFLMHDSRASMYIDEEEKQKIGLNFIYNYPSNITEEEIEYIIANDYFNNKTMFMFNLKTDIEAKRVPEKYSYIVSQVLNTKLDLKGAVNVIDDILKNNQKGDIRKVIPAIKTFIKTFAPTQDVRIYFRYKPGENGCSSVTTDGNYISLNLDLIMKFINNIDRDKNPELMKLFETMFHELRHQYQFTHIENEQIDKPEEFEQYKESIAKKIMLNYYSDNYIDISFEREARIAGAALTVNFISKFFPYMVKTIEHYSKNEAMEREKKKDNRKMFELSGEYTIDQILSKIVSVNPGVLEKYPLLKKQFSPDGTLIEGSMGF